MFNRVLYKKNALEQLEKRKKIPVLVSSILLIVFLMMNYIINESTSSFLSTYFSIVFVIILGLFAIASSYFYLKLVMTKSKMKFNDFFIGLGFYWKKGILGGLCFFLWVFLWSLLFFVPGIVKAISYSQMFFIMVENPKINIRKAMHISKIMMEGHKTDYFVMILSFLGWAIVSSLTMFIGYIFLIPYMNASFANAYLYLKMEAFNKKTLTPADFLA